MRISGGQAKGVRLEVPPGARPTSERVRQAVLSSISHTVPGARVLDLYCGSGAFGLEALSRGAASAVFVDRDPRAVAAAKANARAAGMSEVSVVRRADAERYLSRGADQDGPFDIVFLDPPYAEASEAEGLLTALEGVLGPRSVVVLEARWGRGSTTPPPGTVLHADRRYGDTRVQVFCRQAIPRGES